MTELWQYSGEPTDEELQQRVELGNHQLGFRHKCPNCGSTDTNFIRNNYWMCHHCVIWFTTEDALGYYDVTAYQEDDRIEEELLEEVSNGFN